MFGGQIFYRFFCRILQNQKRKISLILSNKFFSTAKLLEINFRKYGIRQYIMVLFQSDSTKTTEHLVEKRFLNKQLISAAVSIFGELFLAPFSHINRGISGLSYLVQFDSRPLPSFGS